MGRTALPFFTEEGKDFGEGVMLGGSLGLSVAMDQATEGTPQRTKVPHTARADFALLAYQRAAIAPRERATCHTRHEVLDPALVRDERSITQRPELDVRTQCRLGKAPRYAKPFSSAMGVRNIRLSERMRSRCRHKRERLWRKSSVASVRGSGVSGAGRDVAG